MSILKKAEILRHVDTVTLKRITKLENSETGKPRYEFSVTNPDDVNEVCKLTSYRKLDKDIPGWLDTLLADVTPLTDVAMKLDTELDLKVTLEPRVESPLINGVYNDHDEAIDCYFADSYDDAVFVDKIY